MAVNFTKVFFWVSLFMIFYTYIGYYIFLNILYFFSWLRDARMLEQNFVKGKFYPKISYIISAYNEEKVIERKLINTLNLDYPKEKLEIIVASDASNDKTNAIVSRYEQEGIILYVSPGRKGKTNVQNEAVKIATGDVFVFSDANAMWQQEALMNLVSNFSNPETGYVAGRLEYINSDSSSTSYSESLYWKYDLLLRTYESKICSITAGNGAIYAVKKEDYIFIDPMFTHDLEFPHLMVKKGKTAIYDDSAVAFEKAGENLKDEFKRKIRMFGRNWQRILTNFNMFNPNEIGWLYAFFMVSHKLLRYLLPFFHIILMTANAMLINEKTYLVLFILHIIFYLLAIIGYLTGTQKKLFYLPLYYLTFQYTVLMGFFKFVFGGNKPYWDKADSTR